MSEPFCEAEIESCECSDKAWVWDEENHCWECENCGETE